MRHKLYLGAALAVFSTTVTFGLRSYSFAQDVPKDDVRYEVNASIGKLVDAANRADIPTVMSMISEKPEVTAVADGEVYQGTSDIQAHAERLLGQRGKYVLQLGPLKIANVHGIAVATGSYTLRQGTGSQAVAARGAVTFVMERGAHRRWPVVHMHRSTTAVLGQLD